MQVDTQLVFLSHQPCYDHYAPPLADDVYSLPLATYAVPPPVPAKRVVLAGVEHWPML